MTCSVSQAQVDTFDRDGVVFVQGAFADWIPSLLEGIDHNIANRSERSRIWDEDARGNVCFYDSQVWQQIPQ